VSQYLRVGVSAEYFPRWQALIGAVREALQAQAPGMVDPLETLITGEGEEVCILVIPHHWLGGVSLVFLARPEFVDLRWAVVSDLSDHDQIDLGHVVDRWPSSDVPFQRLGAVLAAEFARPIEWSCLYRGQAGRPWRIRAYLNLSGDRTRLDVLSQLTLWPWPHREVIERTSLSSANAPGFRLAVPIDRLLEQA